MTMGLLSACRSAAPAVRFTQAPWPTPQREGVHLATDHFNVYTTVEEGPLRSGLPSLLETAYVEYEKLLPPANADGRRLTTYVFATRSEWDRFAQERFPQSYPVYQFIRSGGFTEEGTAVLFHTTPSATLATVAHEGWHQYVETHSPSPVPAWLNEGLACCLESFDFTHQPPRPSPLGNTFRLDHLRTALAESKVFAVHELLDLDPGDVLSRNHSGVTQTYYAGVWGLVAFLRYGQDGRHAAAFNRMMSDLADGTLPIRVRAAMLTRQDAAASGFGRAVFTLYFGAVDEPLQRAYHAYLVELAGL